MAAESYNRVSIGSTMLGLEGRRGGRIHLMSLNYRVP